ncbi:MAG: restriction endonuclease [Oscillospiraceae bacterium]|jgi:hypothetical protein|nr:restriction endonuclease [Oscillospiraceae bacterium]
MKFLKESDIQEFLDTHNYDIRLTGNARWIDQKCAADVVTIVSDCILQYADSNPDTYFTSMDIWYAEYTVSNVADIFKKPSPNEEKAKNEYDKFFQQPMEMLVYAGVLEKDSSKNKRNFYKVVNRNILEYLAIRERNALTFLQLYITKVLTDSDLISLFNTFFEKQTKNAYDSVKDGFTNFTIQHTKINGATECHRIFIKIINPLAYKLNKCGTERGTISNGKITYDMLMYNRDNFRDIYADKPKELTRKQYADQKGLKPSAKFNSYMSQKAKRLVRMFNDTFRNSKTEVFDKKHNSDLAVNIHHIFPEAEFPEICAYYENLIALTPTQHFSYAHPNGNTNKINIAYQHICLLAKASVIKETLEDMNREQIYEFGKFMHVCFVGLDNDTFTKIADRDFDGAITAINLAYSA